MPQMELYHQLPRFVAQAEMNRTKKVTQKEEITKEKMHEKPRLRPSGWGMSQMHDTSKNKKHPLMSLNRRGYVLDAKRQKQFKMQEIDT